MRYHHTQGVTRLPEHYVFLMALVLLVCIACILFDPLAGSVFSLGLVISAHGVLTREGR